MSSFTELVEQRPQIAGTAGVSVDTVYASVGRKPALLKELVETSLSGTEVAVPAHERAT